MCVSKTTKAAGHSLSAERCPDFRMILHQDGFPNEVISTLNCRSGSLIKALQSETPAVWFLRPEIGNKLNDSNNNYVIREAYHQHTVQEQTSELSIMRTRASD